MAIHRAQYISDLKNDVQQILEQAVSLRKVEIEILHKKPQPESWSVVECLEHLNRYSEFYISEIETRLNIFDTDNKEIYTPGWMGQHIAQSMTPKEGIVKNKMKAFKSKNPSIDGNVNEQVLEKFINDQEKLLKLLDRSKSANLNARMNTTLPFLKLKIGDALTFFINHEVRHMLQIEKTLSQIIQ